MTKKRKLGPRTNVPSWDDYYMALCFVIAAKSKDPSTQHGAVLADIKHRPLGFGFNGPSKHYKDHEIDWSSPAKYPYIRHAEENAIRHARIGSLDGLDGSTMYITGAPCSRCADSIISYGIKKVIYGPQKSKCVDEEDWQITKMLFANAGILFEMKEYGGNLNWLRDWIAAMGESHPEVFG